MDRGNIREGGIMSQGGSFNTSGGGGASITLNGDSGSASGSTILLEGYGGGNAGATVKFVGSGSTMKLNMVDANDNIFIGRVAGVSGTGSATNTCLGTGAMNGVTGGSENVAIGYLSLFTAQNSSQNVCVGKNSLMSLSSGVRNCTLGYNSGINYTGSESSNIMIGNSGTVGESNVIRIGAQGSGAGQQNTAFMAGIVSNTVSNPQVVVVNSATGQLGVSTGIPFPTSQTSALDFTAAPGTTYTIYTVPTGKTFLTLFAVLIADTITGWVSDGQFSAGTNATDYDNMFGNAGAGTLVSTNFLSGANTYVTYQGGGGGAVFTSGQSVVLKMITSATATVATAKVNLVGMFI